MAFFKLRGDIAEIDITGLGREVSVPEKEFAMGPEKMARQVWDKASVGRAIEALSQVKAAAKTACFTGMCSSWVLSALAISLLPMRICLLRVEMGEKLAMPALKMGAHVPEGDMEFTVRTLDNRYFVEYKAGSAEDNGYSHDVALLPLIRIPEVPEGADVYLYGRGTNYSIIPLALGYARAAGSVWMMFSVEDGWTCAMSKKPGLEVGDYLEDTLFRYWAPENRPPHAAHGSGGGPGGRGGPANGDTLMRRLMARLDKLELELAKEKAVTQIQNCMGRYAYMHTGGKHTECMECFATGDPDLSIEIGPMGKFYGPDAAHRVYHLGHNAGEGDRIGFMAEHTLTTPVIEVADDLKTAKAAWISPGHETGRDPETGEAEPEWMWGRYAMDFKCVDGEWKIWHFQMFPTFRCSFYRSWAETEPFDRIAERAQKEREAAGAEEPAGVMGRPDFPTSFMEEYAPDRAMKYWPAPPEPYAAFEGTRSMVGAPEGYVRCK